MAGIRIPTKVAVDQPPELLAFDGERALILLRHEGKSWVTRQKPGEP